MRRKAADPEEEQKPESNGTEGHAWPLRAPGEQAPAEPKSDLLEGAGPGVGPQEKNPAVEKAAKEYVKVRNARMALTKQEVLAKTVLLKTVLDAGLKTYRYEEKGEDDEVIEQEIKVQQGKANVRVRTVGGDDDEAEEEESEE
jgi:hypothetical protein